MFYPLSEDEQRRWAAILALPEDDYLAAVRRVYDTIAANEAPLAFTFVHQVTDGEGTWDIFHMSRRTYLAHCNRISGPGSDCEP